MFNRFRHSYVADNRTPIHGLANQPNTDACRDRPPMVLGLATHVPDASTVPHVPGSSAKYSIIVIHRRDVPNEPPQACFYIHQARLSCSGSTAG